MTAMLSAAVLHYLSCRLQVEMDLCSPETGRMGPVACTAVSQFDDTVLALEDVNRKVGPWSETSFALVPVWPTDRVLVRGLCDRCDGILSISNSSRHQCVRSMVVYEGEWQNGYLS